MIFQDQYFVVGDKYVLYCIFTGQHKKVYNGLSNYNMSLVAGFVSFSFCLFVTVNILHTTWHLSLFCMTSQTQSGSQT